MIGKDVPFALLRAIVEMPDEALHGAALPHPGHRAHVRGAPAAGAGVHLQARAHARGGVRQPAPGPAARAPRPHRGGDGGRRQRRWTRPGPACRADRPARASRAAGRALGEGRRLSAAGRSARWRPLRESAGRHVLRAGARRAEPPAGSPRHPGNWRSIFGSICATCCCRWTSSASMFDHLQQAERLAISLDDRYRLGWVSAYLTACYCNDSRPAEAEAAGLRAMAIADERADLPLQVMAHFFLGLAYVYACRWRESIELLSWNVDRLHRCAGVRAVRGAGPPGGVLAQLPAASAGRGRPVRGGACAGRGGRSAVRIDRPPAVVSRVPSKGWASCICGAAICPRRSPSWSGACGSARNGSST